jgi:nicotinamide-nucleotide amidase
MCGFITYSNASKTAMLGVPEALIATHGAVSAEVAKAMAEGARAKANVDIAVSVTGIAGPGGGSAEKPVGLVYIGVATANGTQVKRYQFSGTREEIRTYSALTSLEAVSNSANVG